MNIAAAVGYLLMRMADYGFTTAPEDANVFDVTAGTGDSFSTLARKHRSTVETLQKLNPGVHGLSVGQVLRCQRASMRKVIVDWKPWTFSMAARRYNGNGQPKGDPHYAKSLNTRWMRSSAEVRDEDHLLGVHRDARVELRFSFARRSALRG